MSEAPSIAVDEAIEQAFLAFVSAHGDLSHGQICQDLFVLWALRGQTAGYFVEAGAFDGITFSNTYLLEHLGWAGLLVEPLPQAFAALTARRHATTRRAALSAADGERLAFRTCLEVAELSRLEAVDPGDQHESEGRRQSHEVIEVPSLRIGTALREAGAPPVIDYLSLDTEGNELDILQDFPFDTFRVRCLTVEHNHTERGPAIERFLAALGFRRMFADLSLFDAWYLHVDEIAARAASLPPISLEPVIDRAAFEPPTRLGAWATSYRARLGRDMVRRGMVAEAERLAAAFDAGGAMAPLKVALAEARGEDLDVTGPLYEAWALADPNQGLAALRGAAWRTSIGDDEAAVALLSASRQQWPSHAVRLGEALLRLDRAEEAMAIFRDLAGRAPENAETWLGQARVLRHVGRLGEAAALLRRHAAEFAANAEYNRVLRRVLIDLRTGAGPTRLDPAADDFAGRIAAAVAGTQAIGPRSAHPRAGAVVEDEECAWQVMYNGIEVQRDGYFGSWMTELITRCGGHHEPQEEMVFDRVLDHVGPGARMIELGAFWCFYTASFLASLKGEAAAIAVEPDPGNVIAGLQTLQRNGLTAEVVFGRVGPAGPPATVTRYGAQMSAPRVDVAAMMAARGWDTIDILHADIQGAEIALMTEIADLLAARRIGYVFVSTHGRREQIACLEAFDKARYVLVAEHDMAESYSFDGLVVARAPDRSGPPFVDLPLRRAAD
ncbi:FkbM family methyltransferase [Acuticoccus sp. I52.16.1]|uniref:FkbM family methyltransferase n=1 Tax=Acuticoccus sp. I52.16.1 TaxID=2928472 RepID=UPI001FD15E6A|nr:FkbM family methyltransferase [Acuticoccus sp. I52.16.1]UOM35369.1 FkbM family methyltransferase [Acuticoccus sp. I52.16.1]